MVKNTKLKKLVSSPDDDALLLRRVLRELEGRISNGIHVAAAKSNSMSDLRNTVLRVVRGWREG